MDSSSTSARPLPPEPEPEPVKVMYKTKAIEYFGRTVSIILQNSNGPCPLISICNVLSLQNNLILNRNIQEVSQEELLTLVADRLIDPNSKIDNTDAGYVENQQQNIANAIELLPNLTTGINVNIKFRRIDDFEFTPECAIFGLLDIPLYHGWIVDPQDIETKNAIGSKSYNLLTEELVSLETQAIECDRIEHLEEDSVDFGAATTATLGVPSPSLSRSQSFTDLPQSAKKGDMEERENILRALNSSLAESPSSVAAAGVVVNTESEHMGKCELLICSKTTEKHVSDEIVTGTLISDDDDVKYLSVDKRIPVVYTQEAACSLPKTDPEDDCLQIQNEKPLSLEEIPTSSSDFIDESRTNEHVENEFTSTSDLDDQSNLTNDRKAGDSPILLTASADLGPSSNLVHNMDNPKVLNSRIAVSEPMYEGEECIMGSGTAVSQIQEPIYEGEGALAEQVDSDCIDVDPKERITVAQGELIRNYLKSTASQLTVYGLFFLQAEVKEHELCVLFRNNHFNTMIKHENELYILATDQGFINQPDLVWEKLNEVNGDTVYVSGKFKEFKMDDQSNDTRNELNVLASTADYIASMSSVTRSDSIINSDYKLAMYLQQEEFEPEETQQSQQPAVASDPGLITDPQASHISGRQTPSSSKQEPSLEEKCNIM